MSSRALRRAKEAGGVVSLPAPEVDEEEEEEEIHHRSTNGPRNAFSMLLGNSSSDTEVKENDGEESSRPDQEQEITKKKKRRKKKSGKKIDVRSSEDNLDLDEVEASVRWVESTLGPAPSEAQQGTSADTGQDTLAQNLLRVENRFLNPEHEMKRIFGSRVVQSEINRARKQRGNRTFQRGSNLVTPKPSWPTPRTGLSMRSLESDEEGNWFTWDHSPQYQAIQLEFLTAVESMDHRRIMSILNNNPMHIDSMLQLSEICKMGEDSAMAAELIERTLYVLESSFHFSFSLANSNCHLDYKRQENRPFFLALFRHISFVSARACYRTSLELTKILLNLDPKEDPMAGILMVDFFALRSRENQWLRDFYMTLEKKRNLNQLPNLVYSFALATYQLSLTDDKLQDTADQLLQDALISFPDVLLPLLDKCSIDVPMHVSTNSYFMDTRATPPALATLCSLYVHRTYHCWKEPEVLPWLEGNCTAVISLIDNKVEKVMESIEHRRIRYQGLPRNIHRHVIMSEFPSVVSALPGNLARAPATSWDPLPPADSINTYTAPPRQQTVLDDPSSLRLFFRSLLPNFNPEEPLPAPGEGPAGAEGGVDLRNSVQSLVGALRELLGNIEVVDGAQGEAGDEASEDDIPPGEWD
jgi:hypothetical protein